jgi:hypothetical protein
VCSQHKTTKQDFLCQQKVTSRCVSSQQTHHTAPSQSDVVVLFALIWWSWFWCGWSSPLHLLLAAFKAPVAPGRGVGTGSCTTACQCLPPNAQASHDLRFCNRLGCALSRHRHGPGQVRLAEGHRQMTPSFQFFIIVAQVAAHMNLSDS